MKVVLLDNRIADHDLTFIHDRGRRSPEVACVVVDSAADLAANLDGADVCLVHTSDDPDATVIEDLKTFDGPVVFYSGGGGTVPAARAATLNSARCCQGAAALELNQLRQRLWRSLESGSTEALLDPDPLEAALDFLSSLLALYWQFEADGKPPFLGADQLMEVKLSDNPPMSLLKFAIVSFYSRHQHACPRKLVWPDDPAAEFCPRLRIKPATSGADLDITDLFGALSDAEGPSDFRTALSDLRDILLIWADEAAQSRSAPDLPIDGTCARLEATPPPTPSDRLAFGSP